VDERLQRAERNGHVMKCSKCGGGLNVALNEDVEVDTCRQCQGIWVDAVNEKTVLRLTEKGLFSLESKLNQEVTRLDIKVDSAYRQARLFNILLG